MALQEAKNQLKIIRIWRCAVVSLFSVILCFILGCGSAWNGRVVHLENGKAIIQPQVEGEIQSGRKLVIYREKTIVHPVTGEVLDTIKDDITEAPVLRARGRTITATVGEPWFSMMEVDDQVRSVRGSIETPIGSVSEAGVIKDIDTDEKFVEVEAVSASGVLRIIKYSGTVADPDTGEVLAVALEPVAQLDVAAGDSRRLRASFELVDKNLGWIEVGDTVVKLSGNMLTERLWFQDPPDGFSQEWIFGRDYLHAIRHYDSGRYREAILGLNDVIQMDTEYRDSGYLLGLCYANLNRHAEAAEQFNSLLKQRPNDAKVWAALAYAYLNQEKRQEAVEAYEKLASLTPDDPGVWIDMGDIYLALGNRQKAERAYRKALEVDKDNEEALHELRILTTYHEVYYGGER